MKKDAHVLSLHNALGAWVFSIQGTIGKTLGRYSTFRGKPGIRVLLGKSPQSASNPALLSDFISIRYGINRAKKPSRAATVHALTRSGNRYEVGGPY